MASQITGISIVCPPLYSGVDHRKYQSSVSLAFVSGIHQWPVDSPHKGNTENISIWWCHHGPALSASATPTIHAPWRDDLWPQTRSPLTRQHPVHPHRQRSLWEWVHASCPPWTHTGKIREITQCNTDSKLQLRPLQLCLALFMYNINSLTWEM